MAASATDYFSKAYQRLTTTLSADKLLGASSMTLNSATNWPTTTGIKASVYNLDSNGDIDVATFCVYRGTVSGSTVSNLTLVEGTDRLHSAGATVSLLFTATHWNDVVTGLLAAGLNQDGTQTPVVKTSINDINGNEVIKTPATASAVNEVTITNSATGNAPSISATGGDTNIDLTLTPKGTGTVKTSPVNALDWTALPLGAVVQVVSSSYSALATGTTTLPLDDTIPQNTEGDQYMSLAITPKSTSNILVIQIVASLTNSGAPVNMSMALFQDSTANAIAAITEQIAATGDSKILPLTHSMAAGTTSSTTFKVRAGAQGAGTTTFNGRAGARLFGAITKSSITITEYKA